MCLHHQRGTFGDGVNDGERRLRRAEEREKWGLMGEMGAEKGAVRKEKGGKQPRFSQSRTTEMAVQLMNPLLKASNPSL